MQANNTLLFVTNQWVRQSNIEADPMLLNPMRSVDFLYESWSSWAIGERTPAIPVLVKRRTSDFIGSGVDLSGNHVTVWDDGSPWLGSSPAGVVEAASNLVRISWQTRLSASVLPPLFLAPSAELLFFRQETVIEVLIASMDVFPDVAECCMIKEQWQDSHIVRKEIFKFIENAKQTVPDVGHYLPVGYTHKGHDYYIALHLTKRLSGTRFQAELFSCRDRFYELSAGMTLFRTLRWIEDEGKQEKEISAVIARIL